MTNSSRPPADLPSADDSGYIHIDDAAAAQLVEAGLAFDADDSVVLHAEHTSLKTSLDDLQKLGVDSVEAHGQGDGEHDVMIDLGLDLDDVGDDINDDLESLLSGFDDEGNDGDGESLFAEKDNSSLDIGELDVSSIDDSIADELRLLGIDEIVGEDDAGNSITRDLDDQ